MRQNRVNPGWSDAVGRGHHALTKRRERCTVDTSAGECCCSTLAVSGCAFHDSAKNWSGLNGSDDKPTYYMTATKVGLKLLIVVPFLGDMGISGLTRDLTKKIKEDGGNEVRIVQGDSEAYFYGWPPFTWVLTPVVSTVAAEYHPGLEAYEKTEEELFRQQYDTRRWYIPWSW